MKRIALVGLSLMLVFGMAGSGAGEEALQRQALEEGNGTKEAERAEPVTAEEILAFAREVWTLALAAEPLNNPEGPDAVSEDGIAHIYDFATLYTEGPALTDEAGMYAFSVTDPEKVSVRGLGLDEDSGEAMARFAAEDASLPGTRERAVIYLSANEAGGFSYGLALRDGQRMTAAEYGVFQAAEGGFTHLSLQLAFQRNLLFALNVSGLNRTETAEEAENFLADLSELRGHTEYIRYATSQAGTDLTGFGPEDLIFSGLNYETLRPADLPGDTERMLMEDEAAGRWLLVVDGEGYSAVFSCDAEGQHTSPLSLTFLSDELEGPRGIRLGDFFHEDYNRFRHGENDTDGLTELLYGTEGVPPCGTANYADSDGMTLRYLTALEDGRIVELYLRYIAGELTEAMLQTL